MNIVYVIFFAAFGLACGMFAGAGNYKGYLGALLPGIIVGLLVSIPMIRQHLWPQAGAIVVCALLGSLVTAALPDSNGFKRFSREQSNLHVRVGSYQLGRSNDDK